MLGLFGSLPLEPKRLSHHWVVSVPLLLGSILSLGCTPRLNPTEDDADSSVHFPLPWETGAPPLAARPARGALELAPSLEAEYQRCGDAIDDSYSDDPLPGAPALERRRAQVLMRAKSEPVVFRREPSFDSNVTSGVRAHQRRLAGDQAREASLQLLSQFHGHRAILRQLFLREGYFYADDPSVARQIGVRLSLDRLFDAPRVQVQRGALTKTALRGADGKYSFEGGEAGPEPAQLLLFDRVYEEGTELGEPLHIDVREALARNSIDQLRILRITERTLLGEARYDDVWVKVLFDLHGPEARLNCLLMKPEEQAEIQAARDRAFRHAAVVRQLRRQIVWQVQAGLPFDEPKTERGQQDGELRQRWEDAYFAGKLTYTMNGDKYDVFDKHGHPKTPQVCVDFLTETLERAGGMYYADRGRPPEKVRGTLDFDELLAGERRREAGFRNFARANPSWFSLLDYPIQEAVPYERSQEFFRFLERHERDFEVGDAVIIRGRVAWDHYAEIHSHTFFVYETDPVTGVPILLAGNSGKPRIVTWDAEMTRAPKRRILHRIRPNMSWLYDQVVLQEPLKEERWATPLTVSERKLSARGVR